MKRFLNGTRFSLFLAFTCLSAILLSAAYFGSLAVNERSMAEYRKQYYQDQTLKLAYALQTHLKREPYSEEHIDILDELSRHYTFPLRYYSSDGTTLLFESTNQLSGVDKPFQISVPIIVKGDAAGHLEANFDVSNNSSTYFPGAHLGMSYSLEVIFSAVMALAVLLSFFVAKRLSKPIMVSSIIADHIERGKRGTDIPVTGTSEMKQLANTINALVADFKRQEEWRKQMMQDLGHELRTPLTSLHSRIEAIIDGIHPATEEYWRRIHNEIDRLCRLLDDLARLSEAEGARFQLNIQRVDIIDLLNDVYDGFLYLSKGKDIRLTFHRPYVPCYAEADSDRLIQILSNLLSNAIKYTPSGGSVEIGITLTETEMIIYCQDNGIGISEQDLPFIFNRFYRVDKSRSRNNGSGGIGVGLSIAKALVEAHGGQLNVESVLDKGSKFYFSIRSGGS